MRRELVPRWGQLRTFTRQMLAALWDESEACMQYLVHHVKKFECGMQ